MTQLSTAVNCRQPGRGDNDGKPVVTMVSWRPRRALSFAEWIAQGRKLGQVGRSVGWWIGDWLNFGNAAYGERYARAARITGYDAQTLMNMTYVASRIEPARRREGLSWTHHAEVASLGVADQERWLTRAEQERLATRCLREEIRRERRLASQQEQNQLGSATEQEPSDVCPACGRALPIT
jgi:signal transduction histidine kinase